MSLTIAKVKAEELQALGYEHIYKLRKTNNIEKRNIKGDVYYIETDVSVEQNSEKLRVNITAWPEGKKSLMSDGFMFVIYTDGTIKAD